ncbi:hypothetical protein DY218_23715 [Streptomyces triticagri]|uniref:Polyprenyl synthetase family protein n=1 Tax=Streptomyces triticagri TaxID=2293568 RepID=A0A372LZV2_9ACTN|nr:polyprenyl synthetase family protein [Streptomyces triticagri]RFU84224.1 hypothetical protein DY218_23715 [Streptomyces triticagri]
MEPLSYVDLHRRLAPDIDAELTAALDLLGPESSPVRAAVAALVGHRTFRYPLSALPLLVHAAETGDPRPAVPVSAVHQLWWISACHFDDVADGSAQAHPGELGADQAQLAAVVGGQLLPLRIIRELPGSEALRARLCDEFVRASVAAADGQLSDLRADTGSATRDSVLAVYRGKSGAPFAMVTAMAALLAGASAPRVELWRELGSVFGLLWQFFNDQEDITSGRHEDLANGTVTHLLACAVEGLPAGAAAEFLARYGEARGDGAARAEVLRTLLGTRAVERFREDVEVRRRAAHGLLDELGGVPQYMAALRGLVDLSAETFLVPDDSRSGAVSVGG